MHTDNPGTESETARVLQPVIQVNKRSLTGGGTSVALLRPRFCVIAMTAKSLRQTFYARLSNQSQDLR